MYFTFFDISALSYNFFRIAPSLILLGSCRVTKNTRNGSVWQLTLYLTEEPSAGSRPRDKREARSSNPYIKEGQYPPPIFFWFINKWGLGSPGPPPPGSATARVVPCHSSVIFSDFLYVRHLYKTHNGCCPSTMHLR